jgi:hypothetical protein
MVADQFNADLFPDYFCHTSTSSVQYLDKFDTSILVKLIKYENYVNLFFKIASKAKTVSEIYPNNNNL